ncbi:MAG: hypothetical protein WC824_13935 [Bacteroidota bacterium]
MKSYLIIALLLCVAGSASAQFKKGNVEMMVLGTAGWYGETFTVTDRWRPDPPKTTEYSTKFAMVALTPSWYFLDSFALELEFGWHTADRAKPAYAIIPNISFNYRLSELPLAAFARAGYGAAMGYVMPGMAQSFLLLRTSDKFDHTLMNAGVGLKYLAGGSGIVRIELNFRREIADYDSTFDHIDATQDQLALILGVGILLQ